jgi:hypothetical protein
MPSHWQCRVTGNAESLAMPSHWQCRVTGKFLKNPENIKTKCAAK